jgi:hypothetical protein
MTKSHKQSRPKDSQQKQATKRRLHKLVNEAVQKVITEYGDVLRRLGKEE